MEFKKGFVIDGEFIAEGDEISITTVRGEVIEGFMLKAAKKAVVIKLDNELENRVFDLEVVAEMEKK